ncbi:unnamed protein product [Rotaria sp. Silwood2]|nr:unnamed protein product [Rotaria sp. Silwood2]
MPRLKPQTFKQEQDSNNNSRKLSVIEYSHLITHGLINVHDDYAEQFLLDTKTCLSNYIRLGINYDQLQRVIENFTRSSPKWQYSTTNNVKTLHSIEDAKEYTKDLADIWELQRYQNGKEFVGMLLRALDQREHPEIAYDYAFTNAQGGDYYILVIIRKYADRIAICSSYQEMTLVSVAYSGVALSEHKLISWLKENASRSLEAHTKVVRSFSANLYTAQTSTISSDVGGDMYCYDSHGNVLQRRGRKRSKNNFLNWIKTHTHTQELTLFVNQDIFHALPK